MYKLITYENSLLLLEINGSRNIKYIFSTKGKEGI